MDGRRALSVQVAVPPHPSRKHARLKEPVREQVEMRFDLPDDALEPSHPARLLWRVLETLDLGEFERGVKSVVGRAGRPTHSPRMLLCLWLYGISRGIGSAREIARRVRDERAFAWIAGGVSVSHDVLSDFRVEHGEALERLLTDVVGVLLQKGLLSLERVAVDGTRVRASASAPSFRRDTSLQACREQALLHLRAVMAAAHPSARAHKAAVAKALDLQARVEEAITTVGELRSQGREEPRASTTDPDARVMKMPDGGFRPAYNVQMAVAGSEMGGARTIVGVRVTREGNDYSGLTALVDQVEQRTGAYPDAVLADGGFASHDGIDGLAERGVRPVVAVPSSEQRARVRKPSTAVAAWRSDMASEEAQEIARARSGLVELTNAHLKSRFGLGQVLVRSLGKVTSVVLIAALASNLLQHAAQLLA